jgi:CIC family chloride channel protein
MIGDALRRTRDRIESTRIGETQRFLLLAILIGVFAGLLVVLFHIAIDSITWFGLESPYARHRAVTALLPALGALVAVFLIARVFRGAKGSGVVDTKAAIYVSDGYVPFSAVIGKFLACSLAIGSGNSLGPEDPSLHMGAGVASVLGRAFGLSRDRMRLIAPVGAAAGLAAAFNTPISAVLFVIEEVLAGWSAGVLGSVVLAAVSATVVVRWFLGNQPLFLVPEFELTHVSELVVHAAIGVAGGLLSVAFVRAGRHLRARFERFTPGAPFLLPVAAGLAVGLLGLWVPEVLGAGYSAIGNALHDRYTWNILLLVGAAKMAATLVCFSARTPGGMFAPALFIGAMIGGGMGGLAQQHWPFPTSAASAYVLVGMGTFFAGVFRAPMTSIFMVFETSASYVIILPVMIANTIAYLISRRMEPVPFFTQLAREEGIDLPSLEQQRESRALRVEDAMSAPPEVSEEHAQLSDLPRLYPDMPLDTALRLFGPHRALPVRSRTRPYSLVGVLSLDDVERAYGLVEPPPPA